MNKKLLIGTGVALLAVSVVRRGLSASKAEPKFQTPRNFKVKRFTLTFDLPFSILNVDSVGYTVQSLGGTLYYKGSSFASYYITEPITVEPNTNLTYTVVCSTYLPDIISTLIDIVKVANKPIQFQAQGQIRMFGLGYRYDETVNITFVADVINAFKSVLSIFKK